MKIPVFVSAPTTLSPTQEAARNSLIKQLSDNGLEARALGRSDYPTELPLREVLLIARHCSGGVILGFEQFRVFKGVNKPGTASEKELATPTPFPTPWNQLEAGILFSMHLPILVFRENGISGGVFDYGVSDVYIHAMPSPKLNAPARNALKQVFQIWTAKVRQHYYDDRSP